MYIEKKDRYERDRLTASGGNNERAREILLYVKKHLCFNSSAINSKLARGGWTILTNHLFEAINSTFWHYPAPAKTEQVAPASACHNNQPAHKMKSCQRHLSLQSLWTLLLTVTLITLTQHSSTFTASALRHTFSVKHDTRFFIGPISTPYGFNENGEYKLTVSKFRVRVSSSSSSSRKNTDPTPEQMFEEIKGLHPGFLLKKFNNENQFNRFMDEILDNPDKCGFGDLMSYLDDNFEVDNGFFENKHDHNSNGISEVGDDDTVSPKSSSVIVDKMVARGPGVVDGGKDGIFLSMNHPKMWKPEEPTLFHTFTAEEAGYYFLFYQICLEPDVSKSGKKDKFLFRELQSTFHLDFDYVNKDALGNRTYLTAGEVMLPHLYLYFSVSYALLLFLWVRSLRGDGNGGFGGTGGRVTVYAIHHLMSAVLALKTLSIFFESLRYHFIRVNGHAELWVS